VIQIHGLREHLVLAARFLNPQESVARSRVMRGDGTEDRKETFPRPVMVSIAFHPGAVRYFKEKGITVK